MDLIALRAKEYVILFFRVAEIDSGCDGLPIMEKDVDLCAMFMSELDLVFKDKAISLPLSRELICNQKSMGK